MKSTYDCELLLPLALPPDLPPVILNEGLEVEVTEVVVRWSDGDGLELSRYGVMDNGREMVKGSENWRARRRLSRRGVGMMMEGSRVARSPKSRRPQLPDPV